MNVDDLIQKLSKYHPLDEVMILDGFNGGGHPRAINLGPEYHIVTQEDVEESSDCEDFNQEIVVVLGYGSY